MKTLADKIIWYRESENRKWKRLLHCLELSLIALGTIAVVVVMQLYGDGTKLQYVFMLFASGVAVSATCLVPPVYLKQTFKRWHILAVTLGLGCGMGISAVSALVILELQLANS